MDLPFVSPPRIPARCAAIQRDEFAVLFQPVIDLKSGQITKAEALVRWNHPTRGMISPAAFIPVAEETGLIDDIGFWVFRQAVQQLAAWRQKYDINMRVAVNNSPVQFQEKYRLHTRWLEEIASRGAMPRHRG